MKKTAFGNKGRSCHRVFGLNGSLAVLEAPKLQIHRIIIMKKGRADGDSKLQSVLRRKPGPVQRLEKEVFLKRVPMGRNQGIAVEFSGKITRPLPSFSKAKGDVGLLALDRIEDPQNFGQIIRTAECAGMDGIVFASHGSVGITDAVLQVSQGAFAGFPLFEVSNLNNALISLKKDGFWVTALENGIQAKPWYQSDMKGRSVIVVGSEGRGIRPIILKTSDFQATIPMEGNTGSLNVTAAVSAMLFERKRQILSKPADSGQS